MEQQVLNFKGTELLPKNVQFCTNFLCEASRKTCLGSTQTQKITICVPSRKKIILKIF